MTFVFVFLRNLHSFKGISTIFIRDRNLKWLACHIRKELTNSQSEMVVAVPVYLFQGLPQCECIVHKRTQMLKVVRLSLRKMYCKLLSRLLYFFYFSEYRVPSSLLLISPMRCSQLNNGWGSDAGLVIKLRGQTTVESLS